MKIAKETPVEDLVEEYPEAAGWMSRRGLRCVVCGEPFWGSLEELATEDGVVGDDFEKLITELQAFVDGVARVERKEVRVDRYEGAVSAPGTESGRDDEGNG
ncbi:MAG: hypothetical protein J7M25_17680 [Deltaproteobacteria bacterium]|nr:hypothetical protein [Deltaproteobacteria bacterium]